MKNVALQTLAFVTLAGSLLCACGGQAVSGGSSGSSGAAGSSSGGSAASGGASGSSSSGGSSGSTSSGGSAGAGGSCVNVDLSSYDQSCNRASDCTYIQSGEVCSGQCGCGNALINASGEARYQKATSSIDWADCFCPAGPVPQCINHRCITQSSVADAGAGGGSCVNVDLSTYDQSCHADSDCIDVTSGRICTGGCACGGSTINADGEARYQATVAGVQTLACPCPADGIPRCIQNHCTLCGFGPNQPAGCGDAE
jgi:hypothetical protein